MKKPNNNKYRNNNNNNHNHNNNHNNQGYSLSYKFDSNSFAGKVSGTALDLIKRYNEMAKDAQSNDDYVTAEIFRQYAEHYRRILTDINDKKGYTPHNNNRRHNQDTVDDAKPTAVVDGNIITNEPAEQVRKEFKVIEILEAKVEAGAVEQKPRRTYRKKAAASE